VISLDIKMGSRYKTIFIQSHDPMTFHGMGMIHGGHWRNNQHRPPLISFLAFQFSKSGRVLLFPRSTPSVISIFQSSFVHT